MEYTTPYFKDSLPYNDNNPKSIEDYSKTLINETFNDILNEYNSTPFSEEITNFMSIHNKGNLGTLIEKYFFFYKPNSVHGPDFPKAKVELKVIPYEKTSKNEIRAGERLVISMIPQNQPIADSLEKSSLIEKLSLILFIVYYRDRDLKRLDYKINYAKLFSIISEECKADFEIIKQDYKIIANKIISGKANELSESDTYYLGACTKGSTAKKSWQPQFYNKNVLAKRRAFSFKKSYMTHILNKYIIADVDTYKVPGQISFFKETLKNFDSKKEIQRSAYEKIQGGNDYIAFNKKSLDHFENYDTIIKSHKELEKVTFDEIVTNKVNKYKGMTYKELLKLFNIQIDKKIPKNINSMIAFRMLGVLSNGAEEFIKANVTVKTIVVDYKTKYTIKENMSFPTFNIIEYTKEIWENSTVYNDFNEKKFFFVIYIRKNGIKKFHNCIFWNMPTKDIDGKLHDEWLESQQVFKNNIILTPKPWGSKIRICNNLPTASKTSIFHIRPHAAQSAYMINGVKYGNGSIKNDTDLLPNGDRMTSQCIWLNNSYVLSELKRLKVLD